MPDYQIPQVPKSVTRNVEAEDVYGYRHQCRHTVELEHVRTEDGDCDILPTHQRVETCDGQPIQFNAKGNMAHIINADGSNTLLLLIGAMSPETFLRMYRHPEPSDFMPEEPDHA